MSLNDISGVCLKQWLLIYTSRELKFLWKCDQIWNKVIFQKRGYILSIWTCKNIVIFFVWLVLGVLFVCLWVCAGFDILFGFFCLLKWKYFGSISCNIKHLSQQRLSEHLHHSPVLCIIWVLHTQQSIEPLCIQLKFCDPVIKVYFKKNPFIRLLNQFFFFYF